VSTYRVSVLDPEGILVYSQIEHSLADAAKTMLKLADISHEDPVRDVLDRDGNANVRVRHIDNRELEPAEKDAFTALLAEFGADKIGDDGPAGVWSLPEQERGE
jgi:hypothetical protein